MCGLFGISALYHRRVWSERGYQVMRRLDHSMIFIFIAGTYTPFCVLLLQPTARRRILLSLVWAGALGGVAAEGHLAARCRAGSARRSTWRWAGSRWRSCRTSCTAAASPPWCCWRSAALAYSVGAVFYALRRPNPWPTVFGHHEFFHACTLVAAICHHIAIYFALYA